jgi:predicted Zn-dependent protease
MRIITYKTRIWFVCFGLLLFGITSCTTIGINRGQLNLISTAQEVEMGNGFAQEIEKQYRFLEVPSVQQYVQAIGGRLAAVSDRKEIEYHFTVVDDREQVNAFALPGGWLYVYTGLLERADNEGELAAVVAHEIGHVAARHHTEQMTKLLGYSLVVQLVLGEDPNQYAALAAQLFGTLGQLKFSRDDELEADRIGVTYLRRAGYRPDSMVSFLEKLQNLSRSEPSKLTAFLSTHPMAPVRVEQARGLLDSSTGPDSSAGEAERYRTTVLELLERYYGSPPKSDAG